MLGDTGHRGLNGASDGRNVHNRGFSSDMRPSSDERRRRVQTDKDRDRKQMLNKALQKAHTAVLLDNAYNYEGATAAYQDACDLLNQVLVRSTADEERKKLDEIRETYTKRIQELIEINRVPDGPSKSLPARPMSGQSATSDQEYIPQIESGSIQQTATVTGDTRLDHPATATDMDEFQSHSSSISPPMDTSSDVSTIRAWQPQHLNIPITSFTSEPMDLSIAPPPLSPRRLPSNEDTNSPELKTNNLQLPAPNGLPVAHSPGNSISWLGATSSNGSSQRSSMHSMMNGSIVRKPIPTMLDDTEAEFDAALDAAVEAAYDDGFDLDDYDDHGFLTNTEEYKAPSNPTPTIRAEAGSYFVDADAEEQERILDGLAKDYGLGDFDFGLQNQTEQSRDSFGSQFSSSTWHNSVGSNRTTQTTSLSTVSEGPETTLMAGGKILGTLPRLSEETSRPGSFSFNERPGSKGGVGKSNTGSVRSRRMSGQNAKQLKIETQPHSKTTSNQYLGGPASTIREEPSSGLRSAGQSQTDLTLESVPAKSSQQTNGYGFTIGPQSAGSRPVMSPAETIVTVSPATPGLSLNPKEGQSPGIYRIPGTRPFLKKNKSSMSLKNRTLSISSPDGSDGSVSTPMSTSFSYTGTSAALSRKTTLVGSATTPSLPNFPDVTPHTTQGLTIFESDIHSPTSPGFPNPLSNNAPVQLEPCPESVLLRPFWLLRCLYQTIAHPRGGYISTKLFVPRDVWRVKGVKLKAIDDKIAQLDSLTFALSRLNQLDTNDMDAVHDEMQALEGTLDAVQTALTKKLGHDVGTHGLNSMFRDAPNDSSSPNTAGTEGGHRAAPKSYLSSWRKLRSKTSGSGLSAQPGLGKHVVKDPKDDLPPTMSTVPMTNLMSIKFARRDLMSIDMSPANMGPNAAYMASLARLCDAVQIVDQIARQVEDPGLRGSSSTHVGLELCVRHASEFFGFYICRFVLADIGLLLDKYLKRGTEWVLA